MTGKVVLDENADREPDYWVWSYKPGRIKLEPFLEVRMTNPPGPEVQSNTVFISRIYNLEV